MVVLDVNLIKKSSSFHFISKQPDRSAQSNLKRVTHLLLSNKNIEKIENLDHCPNVTHIYLHDNRIQKIENLGALSHLTALYLQNNKIKRIEDLGSLSSLQKLYLGRNQIQQIEGLEGLINLEELNLESQQLAKGQVLSIKPLSFVPVKDTLRELVISNNYLKGDQLGPALDPLHRLEQLDARHCGLDDVSVVPFSKLNSLTEVNFVGNPMCSQHHYREAVIASLPNISCLDGKDISEITRHALQKLRRRGSALAFP